MIGRKVLGCLWLLKQCGCLQIESGISFNNAVMTQSRGNGPGNPSVSTRTAVSEWITHPLGLWFVSISQIFSSLFDLSPFEIFAVCSRCALENCLRDTFGVELVRAADWLHVNLEIIARATPLFPLDFPLSFFKSCVTGKICKPFWIGNSGFARWEHGVTPAMQATE